jgi:hypothetical protein
VTDDPIEAADDRPVRSRSRISWMRHSKLATSSARSILLSILALTAVACGGLAATASDTGQLAAPSPTRAASAASSAPSVSSTPTDAASPGPDASGSQPPDTGGGTSHGDIPDNAVFLTYRGTNPTFSIQYVEGWQVSRQTDGVVIRDKDSSETVTVVGSQLDVAAYVASTDLVALRASAGFSLVKQDSVKVGGSRYVHLVYHLPSPPDPVTGKQIPSTVDRYYVPGPTGLAIVSLSTPAGVDNVDAFRQMISSFRWP